MGRSVRRSLFLVVLILVICGFLGMVFAHGMRQLIIGLAVGLAASFGLTRVLATLLVGVTPADPLTFVTVALVLTLAAVVGTAIPARRAMQVDPIVALRYQ